MIIHVYPSHLFFFFILIKYYNWKADLSERAEYSHQLRLASRCEESSAQVLGDEAPAASARDQMPPRTGLGHLLTHATIHGATADEEIDIDTSECTRYPGVIFVFYFRIQNAYNLSACSSYY
jgi:hypothetical protein